MPQAPRKPRGNYPKGLKKRAEILDAALEIIARDGYKGASLKAVADAVGLSQAGVLHHFASREELMTAVLIRRDEADLEQRLDASLDGCSRPLDMRHYPELIRHNTTVPGLVDLFVHLYVEAADPSHPAHQYFRMRTRGFQDFFAHAIAAQQQQGEFTDAIPATSAAAVVQALADGLQLRWLQDPDFDMAGVFRDLLAVLMPATGEA